MTVSCCWLYFLSGHKGHHRGGDCGRWKGGGEHQDCGCGSDRVYKRIMKKINKDLAVKPSFLCWAVENKLWRILKPIRLSKTLLNAYSMLVAENTSVLIFDVNSCLLCPSSYTPEQTQLNLVTCFKQPLGGGSKSFSVAKATLHVYTVNLTFN